LAKKHNSSAHRLPRTGEKRKTRQPFKLDRMKPFVREIAIEARREGYTWKETARLASIAAGETISAMSVHRWYDVRIFQGQRYA
jgi:hypothetical protein